MALVANTVDVDTVRLDELDDADGTCSLGTVVLNVVVVVYKLLDFDSFRWDFNSYRREEP